VATVRRPLPKVQQFLTVLQSPLNGHPQDTGRKITAKSGQSINVNYRPIFPVLRVEVRWRMIVKIHLDFTAKRVLYRRDRRVRRALLKKISALSAFSAMSFCSELTS
jgi:hypothetical protein